MAPLNTIQKTSIIKRIDFIETELKDLDEYKILDFNTYTRDRKVRRDVERIIENIVNATIDIGKIILAGEDIELPDTYREIFIKLGASGLIDTRLAGCLSDLARLRNILAHQYLDIKWAMINDFLVTQKAQVRLLPLKTLLQVDVRCGKDYKSITDQYSVIFLETITNNCFCPKGYTL